MSSSIEMQISGRTLAPAITSRLAPPCNHFLSLSLYICILSSGRKNLAPLNWQLSPIVAPPFRLVRLLRRLSRDNQLFAATTAAALKWHSNSSVRKWMADIIMRIMERHDNNKLVYGLWRGNLNITRIIIILLSLYPGGRVLESAEQAD